MYSKVNRKSSGTQRKHNFFVGSVKGEVKKVRALWNRVTNRNGSTNSQIHDTISRRICSPIPMNQDKISAIARGEDPERSYMNSIFMVKII